MSHNADAMCFMSTYCDYASDWLSFQYQSFFFERIRDFLLLYYCVQRAYCYYLLICLHVYHVPIWDNVWQANGGVPVSTREDDVIIQLHARQGEVCSMTWQRKHQHGILPFSCVELSVIYQSMCVNELLVIFVWILR